MRFSTVVLVSMFASGFSLNAAALCPDFDEPVDFPGAYVIDTCGYDADEVGAGDCGGDESTSRDAAFAFVPPVEGLYTFDLSGADFDTTIYIREGTCDGSQIACDTDAIGEPVYQSRLSVDLEGGDTYWVFIDGAFDECGEAIVSITLDRVGPDWTRTFRATQRGALTVTGNSLVLDADWDEEGGYDRPGREGTGGTFLTLDSESVADSADGPPSWPAYTTDDWRENGSSGRLEIPEEAAVSHALLVWGGTHANRVEGVDELSVDEINTPVLFSTPDSSGELDPLDEDDCGIGEGGAVFGLVIDPIFYAHYCDVTELVSASGVYSVEGVPAISDAGTADDTVDAAGWTLIVAYEDPTLPVRDLSVFGSLTSVTTPDDAPVVSLEGFCTPAAGTPGEDFDAFVFASAVDGDPSIDGDFVQFGPSRDAVEGLGGELCTSADNFFSSQLCNLMGRIDGGASGIPTHAISPATGDVTSIDGARTGWDIIAATASHALTTRQTAGVLRFGTNGDIYTVNLAALQIDVGAPTYDNTTNSVTVATPTTGEVGDTIEITTRFQNEGIEDSHNLVFHLNLADNADLTLVSDIAYTCSTGESGTLTGSSDDFLAGVAVPVDAIPAQEPQQYCDFVYSARIDGPRLGGDTDFVQACLDNDYVSRCDDTEIEADACSNIQVVVVTGCDDEDEDRVCDDEDDCQGSNDSGDSDGDGVCDDIDPCPDDNPDDANDDGECDSGDVCEGDDTSGDTDGDGICDDEDPCPLDDPNDTDDDGICDSDDACVGVGSDSDGDGTCDDRDLCDGDDSTLDVDSDGLCGDTEARINTSPSDADSDDDGLLDGEEPLYDQDVDGDGLVNALDPDSDGDGLLDGTESGVTEEDRHSDTNPSSENYRPDLDPLTVTDPTDPDSDDGGECDGPNAVPPICVSGEDQDANGRIDRDEHDPNNPADDLDNIIDDPDDPPTSDPNDDDDPLGSDSEQVDREVRVVGGGCSTAPARSASPLVFFFVGGALLLGRRRRNEHLSNDTKNDTTEDLQ